MADPVTFSAAALGMAALTEGIKFLYGQAGDLLKHWRQRKDAKGKDTSGAAVVAAPAVKLPEAVFAGQLVDPAIHVDALNVAAPQLLALRQELMPYVEGVADIATEDRALLDRVDALRNLLEAVYQQRVTFRGEQRDASGPIVNGFIDAKRVAGEVEVLRANTIASGRVNIGGHFDTVEKGGKVTGLKVDKIG